MTPMRSARRPLPAFRHVAGHEPGPSSPARCSDGHLGDTNDLTIIGALGGVEMALSLAGVPHRAGGVQAAMAYLTLEARGAKT